MDKNKLNWSNLFALLALVVSAVALGISWSESKKNDREELIVRASPRVVGLPVRISSTSLGDRGYVVHIPYQITVSNVGRRDTSIISHECIETDGGFYSGINGGLFDSTGQPMHLPINISSGETKDFIFYLGTLVPSHVKELLQKQESSRLTRRDVLKVLGKSGVGLYGQKVEYKEFGDGAFSVSLSGSSDQQLPTYFSKWKTGSGDRFFTLLGEDVGLID